MTSGDSRIFPKEKLVNLTILTMSLYANNEELIEIIKMLPERPKLVEPQIEWSNCRYLCPDFI